MLFVVGPQSCGRKPHLIWTLLAPSTYKYVHSPEFPDPQTLARSSSAAGHVRASRTRPPRRPRPIRNCHVASRRRPRRPRRPPAPPPPSHELSPATNPSSGEPAASSRSRSSQTRRLTFPLSRKSCPFIFTICAPVNRIITLCI